MALHFRGPGGQSGSMLSGAVGTLADRVRAVPASLADAAGCPARYLASFMDDVDEVWLVDVFLDQPDGFDPRR